MVSGLAVSGAIARYRIVAVMLLTWVEIPQPKRGRTTSDVPSEASSHRNATEPSDVLLYGHVSAENWRSV
jgi:hypothetical protein